MDDIYEDRLVLYADILGWSTATRAGDPSTLFEIVRMLHEPSVVHNERHRSYLSEQWMVEDSNISLINPLFLETQFGAFSDCIVYSMPAKFGGRILQAASMITLYLLWSGFLVRGAITKGGLYHKDNVVFGPALTDAVAMEQNEAFYPRILVAEEAAGHIDALPHDPRHKAMIFDQLGRRVANPFAVPIDGPDRTLIPALQEIFQPTRVDAVIAGEIATLTKAGMTKQVEKWEYMRRFVTGPVMEASPVLRRVWA